MTRDIFKTILLFCALLCFTFAISSCGEEPRSTHLERQNIDTPKVSMPQALRVIPGNDWPRWISGDSILINGFGALSMDNSNGKQVILTDTSVLRWLVAILPDSLALSGYADTLRLSNDTLYISGQNYVLLSDYLDNTDAQTLSFNNPNLSISGGNSVDLSALSGDGGSSFFFLASEYGIQTGTSSDQSDSLLALIELVNTSGGGTIIFDAGVYRFDQQIILHETANEPFYPYMNNVRWIGAGAHAAGRGRAPTGGTIFDIRSNDTLGRFVTKSEGLWHIEGITFDASNSTGDGPIIFTTGTTIHVTGCSFRGNASKTVDGIRLGNYYGDAYNSSDTAAFQGYGTVIQDNYFNRVDKAVEVFSNANAVIINNNTIWNASGGNHAIFVGHPSVGTKANAGGSISGNLIEVTSYVYGIEVDNAISFNFNANNFYDAGGGTLGGIHLTENAKYNVVIEGFNSGPGFEYVIDDEGITSTNLVIQTHQGSVTQVPTEWEFLNSIGVRNPSGIGVYNYDNDTEDRMYWQMTGTDGDAGTRTYKLNYDPYDAGAGEIANIIRLGPTTRVLSLKGGTADNRIEADGQLKIQANTGATLWLGDKTVRNYYISSGTMFSSGGWVMRVANNSKLGWSATASAGGGPDVTVERSGTNLLRVGNNASGYSSIEAAGFQLPGGLVWTSGTGDPEGSVTAPVGSLYSRTDGSTGTTLYVKESGTGNTGWAAK